ncbi:MAG: hypothetical protein R3F56_03925 [Planctomycetota bacterium]
MATRHGDEICPAARWVHRRPTIGPTMKNSIAVLFPLAATTMLAAQGAVIPTSLSPIVDSQQLSPTTLGVVEVNSISAVHLMGDPAGTYYLGLTVRGLSSARGGVGGLDLLTGRYDRVSGTFVEDGAAAALNTASDQFAMSVHASGLLAVTDDYATGTVQLAQRASVGQPFTVAGAIVGLTPQGYYDPALATIDGQLHLLATFGNDIAALPLDAATRTVGAPRVIARVTTAGRTANSAQPIVDGNGDMVGLSFHELESFAFTDNDQWIAADLDPATPALRVVDSNEFFSNGAYVGGHYIAALSDSAGYRLVEYPVVWCTGGRARTGTTMSVLAFAPPRLMGSWLTSLLLSGSFITPVSLPFAAGSLGVDPTALVTVTMPGNGFTSGEAVLQIPVPNVASLRGRSVPAQTIAYAIGTTTVAFGNTCALTVQ